MQPEKKMVCDGMRGGSSPMCRNSEAIWGVVTLQCPAVLFRFILQRCSQSSQEVKSRFASSILRSSNDCWGAIS